MKRNEVYGMLCLSKRKTHHYFNTNLFAGPNGTWLSLPLETAGVNDKFIVTSKQGVPFYPVPLIENIL